MLSKRCCTVQHYCTISGDIFAALVVLNGEMLSYDHVDSIIENLHIEAKSRKGDCIEGKVEWKEKVWMGKNALFFCKQKNN